MDMQSKPTTDLIELALPVEIKSLAGFERPLATSVRDVPLLSKAPWVRTLGKLTMEVMTQGWRFPTPGEPAPGDPAARLKAFDPNKAGRAALPAGKPRTRLQPPGDMVLFKDRLLYLL